MNRFIDFDEIFAPPPVARVVEPVRIKLFHAVWELPGEPAPDVVARLVALAQQGRDATELTRTELFTLVVDLLPGDVLAAWLIAGITLRQLGVVLEHVVAEYMDGVP